MASSPLTQEESALRRLLSLQSSTESDAAFAERIGLAPQVLSNYKNQHHGLSLRSALRVHQATGISLDWLLAGKGAPELTEGARSEGRPFEAGGRYLYDRLLRSVLAMTEAAGRAGIIDGARAGEIREPIENYLKDAGTPGPSGPEGDGQAA